MIVVERGAQKDLARLPTNVRGNLLLKIEQLADDPAVLRNNVKKLVGTENSRLRVGDWRIVFRIEGDNLIIMRVAPRGRVYD